MPCYESFHFVTTKEPLQVINQVYEKTKADLAKIVANVWDMLPSQTAPYPVSSVTGDENYAFMLDSRMLERFLARRFVYWPGYNLLALLGSTRDLGHNTCDMFPTVLLFSEDCEPNPVDPSRYEHIRLFEQVRDSIMDMSDMNIGTKLTNVSISIQSMLEINKCLTGEPSENIYRITTAFVRNKDDEDYLKLVYRKIFELNQKSKA